MRDISCDECGLCLDGQDIENHAYETNHIHFTYTGNVKKEMGKKEE